MLADALHINKSTCHQILREDGNMRISRLFKRLRRWSSQAFGKRHSPAAFRACRNAGNSASTAEGTTSKGTGSINCEVEFCIFYRLSLRTLWTKDVYVYIHMYTYCIHAKYPLFLSDLNEPWIFLGISSRNTQISNFMKILLMGSEFFHTDRLKDRHDEAKSHFCSNLANAPKICGSRNSPSPLLRYCLPLESGH
jgi:hypothetical protein